MSTLNLIGAGAMFGVLATLGFFALIWLWEDKRPIFKGVSTEEKERHEVYFRRFAACVWLVGALSYISLTYWWPK